jgi:hypothetical protein
LHDLGGAAHHHRALRIGRRRFGKAGLEQHETGRSG